MSARATRLAWAVWLVALGSVVAGTAAVLVADTTTAAFVDGFGVTSVTITVSASTVGWLLATRRPANPLGWLLLAVGVPTGVSFAVEGYAVLALDPALALPGGVWAGWFACWFWTFSIIPLPLVVLLLPDGHLPSARWRPVAWAAVLAGVAALPYLLFFSGDPPNPALPDFRNPLAWPGPQRAFVVVHEWSLQVQLLVILTALGGLVVRYRRGQTEERHQLKWIAAGATVAFVTIVAFVDTEFGVITNGLAISAIPVSIGVAVLRYRLFEIDVVISRAVVFAGLAGFITVVYVGIVVGVGELVGAGDEPNLALSIAATALVAVAFQPVRDRLTRVANRLVYGRRAEPYEVLSRFAAQLGEAPASEATLVEMARLLAEGTGARPAVVWLRVGDVLRPEAAWPTDEAPTGAIEVAGEALPALPADRAVPVIDEGVLLGALSISKGRGEAVTPVDDTLLSDLAGQAGLVLRNLRPTAELRQRLDELKESRRRLVEAQDAERRRLERDLHDGAQQQLVALKLKLGLARRLADQEHAPKAGQLLDQLSADSDDAVATLRELAHGIYPPLLAAEGLPAALTAQARKAAPSVVVEADGIGRYPQDVEAAVYFCVLEALNNAAKYAAPTQVTVRLHDHAGQLTFQVTDDGVGFDPATTPRGHGTTNMTDRLDALDGTLTIHSRPGHGTTITGALRVPATGALSADATGLTSAVAWEGDGR